MDTLEKRVVALQQRLEKLTVEVASLAALASTHTTTASLGANLNKSVDRHSITNTPAPAVGLDRFRQLAQEQA